MKTKHLIFPLFFVFCLSSTLFFTDGVGAVSYYNWIENPSFQTYINYVEDSSFESSGFNSGIVYGNWSDPTGKWGFSSSQVNSGVYSIYGSTTGLPAQLYVNYTLSDEYDNILGADIVSFYAYFKATNPTFDAFVSVYYSDASYDSDTFDLSSTNWEYVDLSSVIDSAKFVEYFLIGFYGNNPSGYLDDVSLTVDDGEGQDTISQSSVPWFLGGTYSNNFGHLNTEFGRLDNNSVQLSGYDSYKLIQNLNYVDTDYINYVNLYVYGMDVSDGDGVTVSVVYSDRSSDSKTKYVEGDGTSWEELNFGKSWIDSDKYIIQFRINFESDSGTISSSNLDDVGLWLSVPTGFTHFSFTISPQPISITSFDFNAYSGSEYVMNCYFYNTTTQTLNENGTYSFSDSLGTVQGNMVNGFFSITLYERTYTATPYTLETITVTIITEDEVFNVQISAYWYPTEGDSGDTDITDSDTMSNLLVYAILFIVFPVAITGSVGTAVGHFNPSVILTIFLGAETLMGAIGLATHLIGLWFMIAIILIDIIVIVALLRSGSN